MVPPFGSSSTGHFASSVNRRTFLKASTMGLTSAALGSSAMGSSALGADSGRGAARAKSTIVFFLCGGASHVDTWDMKPNAPAEYRGEFNPVSTSASGIQLCEHLPLTAQQAHHLAIVNSVGASVSTNDHHAGYYYNLTGHVPDPTFISKGNNRTPYADDWPYMGSVVSAKGQKHPNLPSAITLPHKPSKAPYTRPGQFAARLGVEHDPLYLQGSHETPLQFKAPALILEGDTTADRVASRQELLQTIDKARRDFDQYSVTNTWSKQQERAFSLLLSSKTSDAFNVESEPKELRERYGETVNGMSLLLARRLVEVGVPFITVFWKENTAIQSKCKSAGGWDTHGNNFNCLKDFLLPEFDRGYSALLEDLSNRNLLDETMVLVTSEMGRTPKIGDIRSGGVKGAGRDHWTHCHSNLFAGGGIRGGQVYGSSDKYGEYPASNPVTPAHVVKTVYESMGVHDLEFIDKEKRPMSLLTEGKPIMELF
ncbi:hypothetical protein Pla110_09250 [Polystyrenella longa]|uniref:Sulfatase n=1 Tax=Polystyrenella longa TaxID=2528007 RepID=A0A518CJ33_9PLAN|nr:DUF1501 domain-containing protein [Polystyrenella longa]QDU79220.1 hypothetical protein Pla110_09250 [Polystyrenella longa]